MDGINILLATGECFFMVEGEQESSACSSPEGYPGLEACTKVLRDVAEYQGPLHVPARR